MKREPYTTSATPATSRALTAIHSVLLKVDTFVVELPDAFDRTVARPVVDDEHLSDPWRLQDPRQQFTDSAFLVECRNDNTQTATRFGEG